MGLSNLPGVARQFWRGRDGKGCQRHLVFYRGSGLSLAVLHSWREYVGLVESGSKDTSSTCSIVVCGGKNDWKLSRCLTASARKLLLLMRLAWSPSRLPRAWLYGVGLA